MTAGELVLIQTSLRLLLCKSGLAKQRGLYQSMITNSLTCIQLFRERLSNKTVRDNAARYYGNGGLWYLIEALGILAT